MHYYAVYFLLILQIHDIFCAELPAKFRRCEVKNPQFNKCLGESVEAALKDLADGSSELNIPSVEPIHIEKMIIGAGNGPVSLVQNLENVLIHGSTHAKITNFNADLNKHIISFNMKAPNLTMEANYDINGRILSLPIVGKGHLSFKFTDSDLTHRLEAEEVLKKGNKYYKVKSYSLKIHPKKLQFYLSDLFNGDTALKDAMLKVMNDNWEILFEDIHGAYEEALGQVFQKYSNRVFNKIPLKNIFIY